MRVKLEYVNLPKTFFAAFLFSLLLSGCFIPGTYYDPFDEYVRGIRWFDRGRYDSALKSWEPLAEAGDCDAQYRLGTLYFLGAGVPRNYDTARHWLLTAANQGQATAQVLLAVMAAHDVTRFGSVVRALPFDCTHGCGTPRDMVEAYKWAALAERFNVYEQQREGIKQLIAKYKTSMTADQIKQAEEQARTWKASPSECNQRRLL